MKCLQGALFLCKMQLYNEIFRLLYLHPITGKFFLELLQLKVSNLDWNTKLVTSSHRRLHIS